MKSQFPNKQDLEINPQKYRKDIVWKEYWGFTIHSLLNSSRNKMDAEVTAPNDTPLKKITPSWYQTDVHVSSADEDTVVKPVNESVVDHVKEQSNFLLASNPNINLMKACTDYCKAICAETPLLMLKKLCQDLTAKDPPNLPARSFEKCFMLMFRQMIGSFHGPEAGPNSKFILSHLPVLFVMAQTVQDVNGQMIILQLNALATSAEDDGSVAVELFCALEHLISTLMIKLVESFKAASKAIAEQSAEQNAADKSYPF